MCRNFLITKIKKTNKKDDRNFYNIILHYVVNSYNSGNKHGYFIAFNDDNIIRTLNFDEYINYIITNKEKIKKANVVVGHLRLATNGDIEKKWVHGWNFKGWYCSHNGIIYSFPISFKNCFENDSYTLFYNTITSKNKDKVYNRLKSALENCNGFGVFIVTNFKYSIIASVDKKLNFHLIDRKILCLNSENDIHKFNNKITIKDKDIKTIRLGKLVFTKIITKVKILSAKVEIKEDLLSTFQNKILLFSHLENKAIRLDDINVSDINYLKYEWYGDTKGIMYEKYW